MAHLAFILFKYGPTSIYFGFILTTNLIYREPIHNNSDIFL